jgi:hypothetical protein
MSTVTRAGIVGFLILFIALFVYISQKSTMRPETHNAIEVNGSSYREKREFWTTYHSVHTSAETYAKFLEVSHLLPYSEAHELSHIVAEILYAAEGQDAILFCTPDHGFGCYHGVAGAALEESGLEIVPFFGHSCRSPGLDYLGCSHGIGHGILAYLGNEKLDEALAECMTLQGDDPVGGCLGGVFMEYNFQTMQSTDGIALREYNPMRFDEPCDQIESRFKAACYYELPSWWRATMATSTDSNSMMGISSAVRIAGERCSRLDVENASVCFSGIGNLVGPNSGYDPRVMEVWCSSMPNSDSRNLCYKEALGHLLQSDEGRAKIAILCESKDFLFPEFCPT